MQHTKRNARASFFARLRVFPQGGARSRSLILRGITMADDASDEDRVGPGRPPKKTRFQKGKSGNPGGRPKGSLNFSTLTKIEGRKKIQIKANGRTKTLSQLEVVVRQTMQLAMKGNLKAASIIIQESCRADEALSAAGAKLRIPDIDPASMRRIAQRVLLNTEEVARDESD
jgi:hypothetical protein